MKVLERRAPTESSEAKLPSDNDLTKNLRRGVPSENIQANIPGRKLLSESLRMRVPNAHFTSEPSKRKGPRENPKATKFETKSKCEGSQPNHIGFKLSDNSSNAKVPNKMSHKFKCKAS